KDRFARENSVVALGKIRDRRAVEPLVGCLTDEDCHVRQAAAVALGEIRDIRALDPLILALEDTDYRVVVSSAKSLGMLNHPKPIVRLAELVLHSGRQEVRRAAGDALREIRHSDVVDLLIDALPSKPAPGLWDARHLLSELTCMSAGWDASRWKEWKAGEADGGDK
ncbi:MAG: HEAT repeat domain-containing protein, partial [Planctomycetota bacterium]